MFYRRKTVSIFKTNVVCDIKPHFPHTSPGPLTTSWVSRENAVVSFHPCIRRCHCTLMNVAASGDVTRKLKNISTFPYLLPTCQKLRLFSVYNIHIHIYIYIECTRILITSTLSAPTTTRTSPLDERTKSPSLRGTYIERQNDGDTGKERREIIHWFKINSCFSSKRSRKR